ncbi:MAG: hypothetical protein V2I33_24940, partial [Kangiellaceae bacterium]|nr:hypothetical protein [Kangiellaceae bacterium]
NGWNDTSSFANENNNGYGININGGSITNCKISNSLIINAGHVAYFFVGGGNHAAVNCMGVAHDTGNGSDYIFDYFGSSNNLNLNCTAIRAYSSTTAHQSRCNTFQARSDNNIMENFTCINARMQFENSNGNKVKDLNISTINGASGENSGSIQIYAQADNNIIENYSITGGGGISFLGEATPESPRTHRSAGENNYFINGKISNLKNENGNAVISFHRLGSNNGITAGNNYVIGLTADNFPWIINANRPGTIHIYNSSFSNGENSRIDTFYSGWSNSLGNYTANFTNSNFYNNNFPNPSGTNISNGNPLLDNNLNPQAGSALIDKGMDAGTLISEAAYDFDGKPRSIPYDLGAYEY